MARFTDRGFPPVAVSHALRMDDTAVLSRAELGATLTPPIWEQRETAGTGHGNRPRILLLTSSLGSGHMRAAQAIEVSVRERQFGADVRTLDFWSLMDEKVAWAVRTAYLRLVQEHPALFDRIYRLDQHMWRAILERSEPLPSAFAEVMALIPSIRAAGAPPRKGSTCHASDRLMLPLLCAALSGNPCGVPGSGRLVRLGLVQSAWARLTRRLVLEVEAFDPDVIVATQMNSAALLSSARKHGRLRVPTIGVPTDFGVHDFWIQTGIEHYCVADESICGLWPRGLEANRVIATGIPLMPGFRQPPLAQQARESLGLDPGIAVVLVAGGGLGLGVHAVAERLLASPTPMHVLAITGHNQSARQSLAPLIERHGERLRVWEWTERMEVFIRAADIVVGKPGGLTVAEVLACGRPLIATRALGGQEGFNVRFLERNRVGRLVPEENLVGAIESLLAEPEKLRRTKERAWSLGRRDGAGRIAELVERVARWRSLQRLARQH